MAELLTFLQAGKKWASLKDLCRTGNAGCEAAQKRKMLIRLEEVDRMIREEMGKELERMQKDTRGSFHLACLMRARADVQGAITSLLGDRD